ncbi:hypothetical protein EV361DRAFT_1038212, partial [Lentinula raphanica]
MTPHRQWFKSYNRHSVPIRLADNSLIYSEGIGTVEFQPDDGGPVVKFLDVLHVPNLRNNLLSPFLLAKQNQYTALINVPTLKFLKDDRVILTATVNSQNVGYLNGHSIVYPHMAHYASAMVAISAMSKQKLVKGLTITSSTTPDPI